MKNTSFSTLALKLKRYNLHFEYDEVAKQIEIGKPKGAKRKMLRGVAIAVIVVFTVVIVGATIENGILRKIMIYATLLPLGYGMSELLGYLRLAEFNKHSKFITPESFRTETDEEDITIPNSYIKSVEIHLVKGEELSGGGTIMFNLFDGGRVHGLSLHGKKVYELKKDMEYIKLFLDEYMGLK